MTTLNLKNALSITGCYNNGDHQAITILQVAPEVYLYIDGNASHGYTSANALSIADTSILKDDLIDIITNFYSYRNPEVDISVADGATDTFLINLRDALLAHNFEDTDESEDSDDEDKAKNSAFFESKIPA